MENPSSMPKWTRDTGRIHKKAQTTRKMSNVEPSKTPGLNPTDHEF